MLGLYGVGSLPLGDIGAAPPPPVLTVTGKIGAIGAFAIGQQSTQTGNVNFTLTADAGAFVVTGNAALFKLNMLSQAGAFLVGGNAAPLGLVLSAAPGSYLVTGNDAALTATSTWNERPEQTENWQQAAAQSESWSQASGQSESWSQATDQDDIWTEKSEESEGWTPQAPLFN